MKVTLTETVLIWEYGMNDNVVSGLEKNLEGHCIENHNEENRNEDVGAEEE